MYQKFRTDSPLLLAQCLFFRRIHFVSKKIFSGNNLIGREKKLFFLFFTPTKRLPMILFCEPRHSHGLNSILSHLQRHCCFEFQLRASCLTPSPLVILLLELNWGLMVQCFKVSSKPRAARASLPKLILNWKVLRAELSLVASNYLQSCGTQSSRFNVRVVEIFCVLFTQLQVR